MTNIIRFTTILAITGFTSLWTVNSTEVSIERGSQNTTPSFAGLNTFNSNDSYPYPTISINERKGRNSIQ